MFIQKILLRLMSLFTKENKSMNTITINGETITTYGNNVVVRNGKVTVDGEVIKEFTGNPTVIINGRVFYSESD